MKNPKEMTDDELYHSLKARKIRMGVAREISSTYSPNRVILTTLVSPVHAAAQVSVNVSGSVAHHYTKSEMDDVVKEMHDRGLDSEKVNNDPETEIFINKWVKLWKCMKLLGTIIAIDLSEVHDMIEVVSDLHEALVDLSDVINDISELCLVTVDNPDDIKDGVNQASIVVDNFKLGVDPLSDLTTKGVEGFKDITSSIDLSILTNRFTLFVNGRLKFDAETIINVLDLADATKDLATDDKKDSMDENSTNNAVKASIKVNLSKLREIIENEIAKFTTKISDISLKSENIEILTTDVTKIDDEKVKNEKSEFILETHIKNITAATSSLNISNISSQISQYTTTISSNKLSDQKQ
ncbi:9712_t:CDS:1 [Cetraspora pellucida]|uniref:9712_t:CDS:1 n=1 Tax=Cetraspora pellucida TaxID=1433469 RepID=A0A9N9IPQ3_9GLOM|nr:9712_t:CDS:1 [Cetraspora pellucida]